MDRDPSSISPRLFPMRFYFCASDSDPIAFSDVDLVRIASRRADAMLAKASEAHRFSTKYLLVRYMRWRPEHRLKTVPPGPFCDNTV